MPDSSTVRFHRLNDTNYVEWALRMEAVLVQSGLWSMIDLGIDPMGKDASVIAGEEAATKKNRTADKMNEARAAIVLRVEDGQLAHCLHSKDPKEIWEELESIHRAAGFATSLALCCCFLMMKKILRPCSHGLGRFRIKHFGSSMLGLKSRNKTKFLHSLWASPLSMTPLSLISTTRPTHLFPHNFPSPQWRSLPARK